MREYSTADIVIGIVASVGVIVLIAVFVYVVREILKRES
jgi:hypothetical protein